MKAVEKLLAIAEAEVGYLEKASNKDLDSKTVNVGDKNYTKYGAYFGHNGPDAYWCDYFVDWCFAKAFGNGPAKQLLCGGFSGYTPTSVGYFKMKGQYHKNNPQPGDQIFFHNGTRIYHTGIVYKVTLAKVYTIEGNTSSGSAVEANGGGVFCKEYYLSNTRIDGYGRPNWNLVDKPEYTPGWNHDNNGWWYADSKTTYHKSCWKDINGHRYRFNSDGYALTGWQEIEGEWYYFEPRTGHPLECALYVSNRNGIQAVGEF